MEPPTIRTSSVSHRAFITNTYSGNLQIVDTQNDTSPLTAETTNSAGQVVPGVPVTITVATSLTFEVLSPDKATTLTYDPTALTLLLCEQFQRDDQRQRGHLPSYTDMALFSPDSSTVYVPTPTALVTGGTSGSGAGDQCRQFDHYCQLRYPVGPLYCAQPQRPVPAGFRG